MFARIAVTVAVILAIGAQGRAQARGNLQIFNDVSREVLRYPQFTIFDTVHAQVTEGVVVLSGKVTMPYKVRALEERVARVDGVRQVTNNLAVLPVSGFDDDLRYRISRAIYGNANFWRYGSMVNPPIHIIVENGRVTLEGVVQSDIDRMIARSLASGLGAFSITNNLKTDAEVAADLETL